MEIEIITWDQAKPRDLAQLAVPILQTSPATRDLGYSVEGLTQWLQRLQFKIPPILFQARTGRELHGWLLLFRHDTLRATINPWALNGHPFVPRGKQQKMIVTQLLEAAILFAKEEGISHLELHFKYIETPQKTQVKLPSIYQDLAFQPMSETALMRRSLDTFMFSTPSFPPEITLHPLLDAADDALYQTYYEIFRTGQDRFFFDQTESERRAFFDETFDRSEPLNADTSLILKKDQQLIGFSLIRPTHGPENVHLWMLGIHPQHRRQGLAKGLLRLLLLKSKEKGYQTMSLACEPQNQAAYSLYHTHGFQEEFRQIEYSWKASKI
jgi:ribosomal protein S18 acetylase RimI-like enzyme